MDKLKYVKLENPDGTYSDSIPLSVSAEYVDIDSPERSINLANYVSKNDTDINNLKTQANNNTYAISGLASGSPLAANSINDMTDITRIYVNTNDGYWYFYNGTNWVQGGIYQSSQSSNELENIRYDIEYKYHDSAGITVRDQIKNIYNNFIENKSISYYEVCKNISIDPTDGSESINIYRASTSFIEVKPYKRIKINELYSNYDFWIRCYDENKNFIGNLYYSDYERILIQNGTARINKTIYGYMIPSDIKFIRLVIVNNDNNNQDEFPNLENIVSITLTTLDYNLNGILDDIYKNIVENKQFSYYEVCKNISINPTDGSESINYHRASTSFIEVKPYKTIKINELYPDYNFWIRCYDENKNFIGNLYYSDDEVSIQQTTPITHQVIDCSRIPLNVKYVRLVIRNDENPLSTHSPINLYNIVIVTLYKSSLNYNYFTHSIKLIRGYLDDDGNLQNTSNNISFIDLYLNNYITPLFIYTIPGTNIFLSDAILFEYDNNLNFIKKSSINGDYTLDSDCYYIKFMKSNIGGNEFIYENIKINTIENINFRKNKKTSNNFESFAYSIDNDHITTGKLKLPSNYNENFAVPLIIFVHGSGDYGTIQAQNMTENYNDYYNFLRDNGYAIFDCYGWGNVFDNTGSWASNTWGTKTNNKCYLRGIEYILDNYNIDENNIFVACKSLGGIQALSLCYQNNIKIKACGMLAPELDLLKLVPFGYNRNVRKNIARDMNFTNDWESVLDLNDNDFNQNNAMNYLITQTEALSQFDPTWFKLLVTINNKIEISRYNHYPDNTFKICDVPLKIWIAEDDSAVSYRQAEKIIESIKNAGCKGELRTMPNNTGGHHSVDNDENAPKVDSITTKLGINYSNVPLAYVELLDYFENNR